MSDNEYPAIAVGGANVYWTTSTSLMSVPIHGGTPVTVASQSYPVAVAADAANVYYTSLMDGEQNGIVLQQPAAGGAVITLGTGQYYPNSVVVDGSNVYWTTGAGGAGTVVSAPIGGGTPVTLAASQAEPASLAANSTTLFWVNYGDGSIHSVPK
jgi:hypothetical protein